MAIRNQKDVAAGLIYVLAGAAFSLGALNYKLGDAARMGPGWFPFWVGVLLAAVGMATVAGGLRAHAAVDKVKRLEFGAMLWILGAVVLFGLLLNWAGLVLSLVVLVLVSSRASHEFSWRGTLVNAAVLVAFSVGAFIKGISLQIPLWPTFLG
ncbi:tripartite tricarboxylate transporter TctB family protein [Ramlibacter sp. PS3R-8]|uniref:tripartite tricarboxylate transporter TctB family protein n=1 Tax=Ramlibacter sp. PS3R-8 TaxID=3133437 RepID=UPI0030B04FD8